MFWDRRKADRRVRDSNEFEHERRTATADRRVWTCGILYRTSLPAREIERWLETYATGKWAVALEGIDDEHLDTKVLKIMFEKKQDKEDFMAAFSGR